jgi:hypothetical protein
MLKRQTCAEAQACILVGLYPLYIPPRSPNFTLPRRDFPFSFGMFFVDRALHPDLGRILCAALCESPAL